MSVDKEAIRNRINQIGIDTGESCFPDSIHNVAIYNRRAYPSNSIDIPNDLSLNPMKRFISRHPSWNCVGIYVDKGNEFIAFEKMYENCCRKKVDLVITKNFSRFSRTTTKAIARVKMLRDCGTEVYFLNENLYTLDTNIDFHRLIMDMLAYEESLNKKKPSFCDVNRYSPGLYKID